jgi:hypothetical protein
MLKSHRIRLVGCVVVAGIVLSGCGSGFGLSKKANPWVQICGDTKAYLNAVSRGDQGGMAAGARQLQGDTRLIPDSADTQRWLQKVADAASHGDPSLAQQNYKANCAPLPSPTNS